MSRGLPEVSVPTQRVPGMDKAVWTAGAAALYVSASNVRLYGLGANSTADPLFLVNTPLGASGGSLLSLGVLPIVLAAFVAQAGVGCGCAACMGHVNRLQLPLLDSAQAAVRRVLQGPTSALQFVREAPQLCVFCRRCRWGA